MYFCQMRSEFEDTDYSSSENFDFRRNIQKTLKISTF
jgi:hypothetical protein